MSLLSVVVAIVCACVCCLPFSLSLFFFSFLLSAHFFFTPQYHVYSYTTLFAWLCTHPRRRRAIWNNLIAFQIRTCDSIRFLYVSVAPCCATHNIIYIEIMSLSVEILVRRYRPPSEVRARFRTCLLRRRHAPTRSAWQRVSATRHISAPCWHWARRSVCRPIRAAK